MKNNKTGIFFLTILLFLTLQSCSVERQLAKNFVKNKRNIPVLLQSTEKLILTNEKLKKIQDFDKFSIEKQDSMWYANTLYLDSVNDIILINKIYNQIRNSLIELGFVIYSIDSIEKFQELTQEKYLLNLAQIEISEDIYTYRDQETFFNNLTYYQDNNLNIINLNYWFELTDYTNNITKVLYNTYATSDLLNGRFTMNPDDYTVSYNYKITALNTEDIYKLAQISNKKNATLLFDYLMNAYIRQNISPYYLNPKYFSYDVNSGFIFQSENENFTIIEQ